MACWRFRVTLSVSLLDLILGRVSEEAPHKAADVVCFATFQQVLLLVRVAVGLDPREAETLARSWRDSVTHAGQRGGRRGDLLDGETQDM